MSRYANSTPEGSYAFSSDDEDYNCRNSQFNKKHKQDTTKKLSHHNVNSSGVSLQDFDRDYLIREYSIQPKIRVSSEGANSFIGVFHKCRRWIETAGMVKVGLLGIILGILCAVLYRSVLQLGVINKSKNNLLPCPSTEYEPCIASTHITSSLSLATRIRDSLHIRAGRFDCRVKSVTSRNATLEELIQQFSKENIDDTILRNAMYLVLYNEHWGIRWLDGSGNNKTRWTHPSLSDTLESTHPLLTLGCRISLITESFWSGVKKVVGVAAVGLILATVGGWWMITREQERKAVYLMVDRILDLLKRHHRTCSEEKGSKEGELLPYLAIIHVRDTLIPPSERKRSDAIWQKACEWISRNESRIRVENRRIAGEDFLVWRWIQEDPPKTEEPAPAVAMETIDSGKGYGKDWSPWTALDHYGPRYGEKVAPAVGKPSPYIRLKNMFDIVRMDDEQAKRIQNSVLERCIPHGSVVHIYVDRKSTFGCVYLKMDSLASASKAYRALHGGWYNGKLVTAKYIEESRYIKWFPHSSSAKQPLLPS